MKITPPMVALSIIAGLNAQVSKFLSQEDNVYSSSETRYKNELETLYTECTEGILQDLKKDILFAAKEDCDSVKMELSRGLAQVRSGLKTLRFYLDDVQLKAPEADSKVKYLDAKVEFCKRLDKFFKTLIKQVEQWSEGALTIDEIQTCYLAPLKEGKEKDLPFIYENLAVRNWIDDRQTSEGDFIYYFTGKGLHPTHPIKWQKSNTTLAILLKELVDGEHWAEASVIFTNKGNPISRKSIGNAYNRSYNTDSYWKQWDAVSDNILLTGAEQFENVYKKHRDD